MSFSSPHIPARQTLRRQKVALFARLRQNLLLKCVSVLSAIVLFVYVRAEHNPNPQIIGHLQAEVVVKHKPPELELDNSDKTVNVSVAGPRALVESLKDGDVRAEVDLANIPANSAKTPPLIVKYTIPTLSQEAMDQISILGPSTVHLQLYAHTKRILPVHLMPLTAPSGYHFAHMEIAPDQITCSGREDRVNSIKSLVVEVGQIGSHSVNGDYQVSPIDSDGNLVRDVALNPERVHISAPLVPYPPERNATVSPRITALPTPPYKVAGISVTPSQIRVVGAQTQDTPIYTVETAEIALQNATKDEDLDVQLTPPPNVSLYDMAGQPITHVHVRIKVAKETNLPTEQSKPPSNNGTGSNDGNLSSDPQTQSQPNGEPHRTEGSSGHD